MDATEPISAQIGQDVLIDRVCWNHPHCGTEDVSKNRKLIRDFVENCRISGYATITLLKHQIESWGVREFDVIDEFRFKVPACVTRRRNNAGSSFDNISTKRRFKDSISTGKSLEESRNEESSFISCVIVLKIC